MDRNLRLISDAGATTAGENPHAVTHVELLVLADFLDDGGGATLVEAHGNFHAIPRAHALLGVGADRAAEQSAADSSGGVCRSAAAELAAEDAAGETTNDGACLAAAFDFHTTERGDAAGGDALSLAGFVT